VEDETHGFEVAAVGLPVSVKVEPTHTELFPVIVGLEFTVRFRVAEQPEMFVYVIVVVPAVNAVTKPVEDTVATAALLEIHGLVVAGLPEPENCEVAFTQSVLTPETVGFALTVTGYVVEHPTLFV
jgi:hypothetical protein